MSTNPALNNPNIESYKLQHPGSCSGMFWRDDPRKGVKKTTQIGGNDWPRNGAILNGQVHELPTMKYFTS